MHPAAVETAPHPAAVETAPHPAAVETAVHPRAELTRAVRKYDHADRERVTVIRATERGVAAPDGDHRVTVVRGAGEV